MRAARLRFAPQDHIVIRGIPRRWVEATAGGHVFERLDQPGVLETLTDADLAYEMTREDWDYASDGMSLANLRASAMSDARDMSGIPASDTGDVLWREAWCSRFVDLEKARRATRSRAGLQAAIAILAPEMLAREVAKKPRTATGRAKRGSVEVRDLPSARTLLRWLVVYRNTGGRPQALRRHYRSCGDRTARFCPEVEVLLKRHAESYLDETRPSKATCHLNLRAEIDGINIERDKIGQQRLPTPSLKTISARIDALNAFEKHAARYGIEAAQRKFAVLGQGVDVTKAGERVELDEWELQVVTILTDLGLWATLPPDLRAAVERIRIWVCVALDAATRAVLGLSFARKPNAASAAAAFRMIMEDKSKYAAAAEATTPWDMRCTPGTLVTDGGPSFIADFFKLRVYSILSSPQVSIAGKPQMRARMERFFSTAHTGFVAKFPGRTFENVVAKGDYDPLNRAAATVQMICDALTRWIVDVYHNRPHVGLGGETPRHAWLRLAGGLGVNGCPGPNKMRHVFGVQLERRTGRHGVVVLNLNYHCDALQAWRRQFGDGIVAVRVDPYDLGRVSVQLGDAWHSCTCMRRGFDGVSIDTWVAAAKDLKRRFAMEAKLDEPAMLAAIRAIGEDVRRGIETFDLGPTRPGRNEIENAERDLSIGFSLPVGSTEQPPLFADAIEVTDPVIEHNSAAQRKRRKPPAAGPQTRVDPQPPPADRLEDDPNDDDPVSTPATPRIDYD